MRRLLVIMGFIGLLSISCATREDIVLKTVSNIRLEASNPPLLKGDVLLYNPNEIKLKLKSIKVDIMVDGKKAGHIDQKLKMVIEKQSDFTVPVEVQVSLKELGLMNTLLNLLGGKKNKIQFLGHIKVSVHGIPIKVPVDYTEELKLGR